MPKLGLTTDRNSYYIICAKIKDYDDSIIFQKRQPKFTKSPSSVPPKLHKRSLSIMTPPHAFVGVSIVEASVSSHDIAPRTGIINNIIPGDNNNIIPPTCSDEEVEAIRVAAREYIKLESASENSRGHGALSEGRGSWHTKRHQIIFVSFLPGEARQERDRQPQ
jgi:hypothetical protein